MTIQTAKEIETMEAQKRILSDPTLTQVPQLGAGKGDYPAPRGKPHPFDAELQQSQDSTAKSPASKNRPNQQADAGLGTEQPLSIPGSRSGIIDL